MNDLAVKFRLSPQPASDDAPGKTWTATRTPYVVLGLDGRIVSSGTYTTLAQNPDGWYRWAASELQGHAAVIHGPIARVARTAISGRLRDDEPEQATRRKASVARVLLDVLHAQGIGDESVALLVEALRLDLEIHPWWGTMKLSNRQPVWDAPEYHEKWPISTLDILSVSQADVIGMAEGSGLQVANIAPPLTAASPELLPELRNIEANRAEVARRNVVYDLNEPPDSALYLRMHSLRRHVEQQSPLVVASLAGAGMPGTIRDCQVRGDEEGPRVVLYQWVADQQVTLNPDSIRAAISAGLGQTPELRIYDLRRPVEIIICLYLDGTGARLQPSYAAVSCPNGLQLV